MRSNLAIGVSKYVPNERTSNTFRMKSTQDHPNLNPLSDDFCGSPTLWKVKDKKELEASIERKRGNFEYDGSIQHNLRQRIKDLEKQWKAGLKKCRFYRSKCGWGSILTPAWWLNSISYTLVHCQLDTQFTGFSLQHVCVTNCHSCLSRTNSVLGLSPWIRDSTKLAYITMLRDTWRAAINKTCSVPQDYKKEVWLVRQHSTAWVTVSATWLWKEKQQSLIFFADPKQGLWHFIRVYKHSKPLPRWPWPPNSSNPITWLETQLLPIPW